MKAMLSESQSPDEFYPVQFKEWADYVIEELNMAQEDITSQYCEEVYMYLANHTVTLNSTSS